MVFVSNTDAEKNQSFRGGTDQPKCLDGFTLLDLQPAQYLKNLPLLGIYQNHKLHLSRTFVIPQLHHTVRDQVGNTNQLPSKITSSPSGRTPDQPGQQGLQACFSTRVKGAAPEGSS